MLLNICRTACAALVSSAAPSGFAPVVVIRSYVLAVNYLVILRVPHPFALFAKGWETTNASSTSVRASTRVFPRPAPACTSPPPPSPPPSRLPPHAPRQYPAEARTAALRPHSFCRRPWPPPAWPRAPSAAATGRTGRSGSPCAQPDGL